MKRPLHIISILVLVQLGTAGEGVYAQNHRVLDADKALTQYVQQIWRADEGLPQNTVRAITQTRDGYLWLGTEEGLVRFDGVRFTVYDKRNTTAFEEGHAVETLFEDRAGVLWIGTNRAGLIRHAGGTFTRLTEKDGLTGVAVSALSEDAAGRLWIGTRDAGLFTYQYAEFAQYTTQEGLSSNHVTTLYQDRQGHLWIGTSDGLHAIREGNLVLARTHADHQEFITTIREDREGTLWVGTRHGLHILQDDVLQVYTDAADWTSGEVRALWDDDGSLWIGMKGSGLGRLRAGRLETFSTRNGLSHDWVLALYGDREGSMWVGTEGGGLNRLWNGKFTTYTTREGLSSNMAMTIFEDRQGNLWIGTDGGGLNRLNDGVLTTYTTADGLSSNIVSSVYQDAAGTVWVGTLGGGLNRFENGTVRRFGEGGAELSDAVYALTAGADGSLWVGTDAGLAHVHNDRVTTYTIEDGLGSDLVAALHEAADGTLWIGTLHGGLIHFRDGRFTRYTTEDGLAGDMVLALHQDTDGALWIGTYEGGLSRFRDGVFTTYTTKEGLFDDNIYQILEDDRGTFWMSCNKGIFSVSREVLNAFADGTAAHVPSNVFSKADGLISNEMTGGIQPAGWKRRDGTLWFPSVEGVIAVDPQHIQYNALPPALAIEAVLVDNKPVERTDGITLSPGKKKIEFQYTALSFIAPEAIRFQVYLEGYDDEWQDVGASRTATYTNLAPGAYTFRVRAHNSDGVWNEAGVSLAFTLKPFFYQTTWFYLVFGAVTVVLFVVAYQGRTQHLRARKRELETLVDARTQDLRAAKEKIEAQAEKLQELDRFKTRFFANVSHEFRTPLTMIVGPLENALQGHYGAVPAPVRRQMDIMLRNALRLMRLINQLLDLSKLEAGRMKLQAHPRNIVEFLEDVVLSFSAFAEQKGVTLRFAAEQDDISVYFEPDKLEKVFYNLLSNAAKFTPRKGEITVSVTRRPPAPAYAAGAVEVRVRDTGVGIPEKDLPYIFDRFTSVDHRSRLADGVSVPEQEGTGIGLALVRELVLLHRGTVDVTSEVDAGTEFVVVLPLGDAHLTPEERATTRHEDAPKPSRRAHATYVAVDAVPEEGIDIGDEGRETAADQPLVLVVEDNADVREYVVSILDQHYRVLTACDGQTGLVLARQNIPDLIVSDVMMPRMDGNALCKAVKADSLLSHVRVILMTARATHQMKIEGLEVGADDYLDKPFNARELLARVNNLIRLQQQEKALKQLNDSLERQVEEQVRIILRERVEYENQLVEAKEQAEQSLRLKSSILNNMNHEFRTPLTAIQGYAQILSSEVKGELKEFAALIHQGGARLMRTLDAVHQLSRLDAEDLDLDLEPVDLVAEIRAAEQRFHEPAVQKGLALRLDIVADERVEALLNGQAVERIIDYLMDNAVKFTEQGEIVLEVARQGGEVVFHVRDTGVGIDEAFLPHLFDAFTQESTGLTRSHEGIGIGLSVARRLVVLLGGAISVESIKGQGSTFTVRFPAIAAPERRAQARMSRRRRVS